MKKINIKRIFTAVTTCIITFAIGLYLLFPEIVAERQFISAIENCDVTAIQADIPNVNINNTYGEEELSPLILALVSKCPVEVVDTLLAVPDIDINQQTTDGFTAIIIAIYNHDLAAFNKLFEKETFDADMVTERGSLVEIILSTNIKDPENSDIYSLMFKGVVRKHPDLLIKSSPDAALLIASDECNIKSLKSALDNGADVNAYLSGESNWTALLITVKNKCQEGTAILLDTPDINIDIISNDRSSALFGIISNNDIDNFDKLVKLGVNPNIAVGSFSLLYVMRVNLEIARAANNVTLAVDFHYIISHLEYLEAKL